MRDRIRTAFSQINAEHELINRTAAYLHGALEKKKAKRGLPVLLKPAAVLAPLTVLAVVMFNLYFTAYAHVGIDIDPSVELSLNRFNTVIGAHSYNEGGTRILNLVKPQGEKYEDAVGLIISAIEADGYFTEGALFSLTIQAADSDREQAIYASLQQYVNDRLVAVLPTVSAEIFPVTTEVWHHAHGCGISPAKYLAIQELIAADAEIAPEAYLETYLETYSDVSIKQIKQRTQECQNGHGTAHEDTAIESSQSNAYEDTHGHGNRNGHGHSGRDY